MHRTAIKNKMKELRISSFAQLSELTGIRKKTVSNFLGKNEKWIGEENLEKIMIALGLGVSNES